MDLSNPKVAHRAEIKKIPAQVQETPPFQVSGPKDQPITPRYWIEIEAEIVVKMTDPSGFIPEFQANWFAVIQDKTTDKSIWLDGKGLFKNLRTTDKKVIISAYIEPDTLERFIGKSKPSVADIEALALTISGADIVSDGKYAAGLFDATAKKEAKWWVKWAHRTEAGLIVAKSKTLLPLSGQIATRPRKLKTAHFKTSTIRLRSSIALDRLRE